MNAKKILYSLAMTGTVLGVLILIWASLGIGIIGADGEPLNAVNAAVVLTAIVGVIITKRTALGMSKTLFAMAAVQTLICIIAIVLKWGMPWSPPLELMVLNGFFVVLFIICGILFRTAAAPQRTLA